MKSGIPCWLNCKFSISILSLFLLFLLSGTNLFATPTLSGPSLFCSSGVYTVHDLPVCATITWSSSSSNIVRSSVQGSNPCTFTGNTNGVALITAIVTNPCGSSVQLSMWVWYGPPIIDYITAESGQSGSAGSSSAFAVWPGPGHVSEPANLTPSVDPYANIWYNSAMYIQIYFQNSGSYAVWATTDNACGTSNPVYYWDSSYGYTFPVY